MDPPFSSEQFFEVFAAYNTGVWPVQVLLAGLALAGVALAFRTESWAGKVIAGILAVLWAWMGIVYHWTYFFEINPAARIFGGMFVLEALILLWAGFRSGGLEFRPRRDIHGLTGAVLIVYALAIYPAIGQALGHRYPSQPTFGLPCPTTIFTVGLLLWARSRVPWLVFVVPVLWSIVGMTAVVHFGVMEDAPLPVAALSAAVLMIVRNRRMSVAARRVTYTA